MKLKLKTWNQARGRGSSVQEELTSKGIGNLRRLILGNIKTTGSN